MIEVSVIICAHNPRVDYLRRTLEALRSQTLATDRWELLLVDNASHPALSATWDLAWHPQGRHVVAAKLGLTHARLSGVAAANADLVLFVDDDNILAGNYLETGLAIARTHPHIGVFGGSTVGEFEIEPPPEIQPYLNMLALFEARQDYWSNLEMASAAMPFGAGMWARRAVAQAYAASVRQNPLRLSLDRQGASLSAKGDDDLALTALDFGLGMGRFKALRLRHLIPKERLSADYILRLQQGLARSHVLLEYIRHQHLPAQRPRWREWLRLALDYLQTSGMKRRMVVAARQGRQEAENLLAPWRPQL